MAVRYVCVAILLMSGLAGCGGADGKEMSSLPSTAEASPSVSLPYAKPPDGGRVRVAEKGFSVTTDGIGGSMISYGVVLENTSRYVPRFGVGVRVLNSAGKAIRTGGNPSPERELGHSVSYIHPGKQYGLGNIVYLFGSTDVAKLKIEIGEIEWWPADSTEEMLGTTQTFFRVKITNVAVESPHGRFDTVLSFTVQSGRKDDIDPLCVQGVFRNGEGKLVGGTRPTSADRPLPPGDAVVREIGVRHGAPDNIDGSKSELFFAPDCF